MRVGDCEKQRVGGQKAVAPPAMIQGTKAGGAPRRAGWNEIMIPFPEPG